MNSLDISKTTLNQKDIEKGQKVIAAVYLVTNHIPEDDPIRQSLRAVVVSFVQSLNKLENNHFDHLEILLGSASLAGLVSEKNSSIIIYEAKKLLENFSQKQEESLSSFFAKLPDDNRYPGTSIKDNKKTFNTLSSKTAQSINTVSFSEQLIKKDTRKEKILSFINERKSAVIKDITSLFPEVSEKTIQRELNALIDTGKITKRGSKRWSIYMAVNSLL